MKKKNVVWGCVALVAVLAVVICIVFAFTNGGEDTEESTSAAAVSDEVSTSEASTGEASTDAEESSEAETVAEPDFSSGLTENGSFDGITATDYVTLCEDYNSIKVPAEEAEVTDEEFDAYVSDNILAGYAEAVEVTDRAVEDGDTVNIDYVGSIDGEEFTGGTAEGYDLTIGSGAFIDGFEEQIIGHEIGEEFDIEVTFPDPYQKNPDMAGKEAVFKITLNSISTTVNPELNDEFVAENFPDYASAEAFLTEIRADYTKNKQTSYVWNYVLENSTVSEVPEQLIENYIEQQVQLYKYMAYSYSMTYEDLLSYYGTTPEEFEATEREYANSDLSTMLISQAICEKESIGIEDGDATKYFGYTEEEMAELYDDYGKGYVNQILLMQKTSEFTYNNSVVE